MTIFGRGYAQRIRDRSEAEARFRYELTRLRENAESVALLGGEATSALDPANEARMMELFTHQLLATLITVVANN